MKTPKQTPKQTLNPFQKGLVTEEELAEECVLPGVSRLRDTAAAVAAGVAAVAFKDDLSSVTVDSARWGLLDPMKP